MNFKKTLICTVPLCGLLMAGNAFAQEDDNDRGSVSRMLDTVTITATKKKNVEDVQDVPSSVTAFNEDTLDALNVRSLGDLTYSSPNVGLDAPGTVQGVSNFSIRGLTVNSSIPSIDPAVGVFVDGVYLGTNYGVLFDMFDLESVEVLRGPQGLLFGRNTTGGAIVVNTSNPTDEFTYRFRASAEGPIDGGRGGNSYTGQAIISGPIIQDRLNGKIGVYYNDDAGYFKNVLLNEDHGGSETLIARGALDFAASSELNLLGKLELVDIDGGGAAISNRGVFRRGDLQIALDNPGTFSVESTFGTLRADLDVDFGDGVITNIFGYRDVEQTAFTDFDGLPIPGFNGFVGLDQDQISNELRYAGTFGNLDVRTGVYYFSQEFASFETRELLTAAGPAPTFYGGGRQEHDVYGVFGQLDYQATENIILSAGLRYSNEEKDVEITYTRPRPECSVLDGTCPTTGINPFTGENNGYEDSDSWSNWTPKIGVQYVFSEDARTYFNYTKGFRSGGYNTRVTSPAAFEDLVARTGSFSFDEEEVDSYELGVKLDLSDGRDQINVALFRTEISDLQREPNTSSTTAAVSQNIVNTADATISGLEVEGRFAMTDNFLITTNVGLIDAEYDSVIFDLSSDGVVDATDLGLDFPNIPEATYGVGFLLDLDLGQNGLVTTRVNYQYRDRRATTDSNFGWIPDFDDLSGNISWQTPVDGLELSIFGRNLLDQEDTSTDAPIPFGGQFAALVPGGENLSTFLPDQPFAPFPSAGTITTLKKGRTVGIELTFRN